MMSPVPAHTPTFPVIGWLSVLVAGVLAPATAMVLIGRGVDAASMAVALGLMGAGMIGAALAGRLWGGVALALLSGAGLLALAFSFGMATCAHPLLLALAVVLASLSFAARGALFATSAGARGWWIAVFVVAGEAAIVASAAVDPGMWPDWLLVLLPAQWARLAIGAALSGVLSGAAIAALVALAGTAAATLLVKRLWPSRWPYGVMFTTWIALSALVHHQLG